MRRRLVLLVLLVAVGIVGSLTVVALSRITSAQIAPASGPTGAKLLLFFEPDFQGPSLEVTGTVLDMPVVTDANGAEFNWNDNVRSLIVMSGTWRLHQNGRLNTQLDDTPLELLDIRTKESTDGWSCVLSATSTGPLRIPSPPGAGFASDVSSIELVSQSNLPDLVLPRL